MAVATLHSRTAVGMIGGEPTIPAPRNEYFGWFAIAIRARRGVLPSEPVPWGLRDRLSRGLSRGLVWVIAGGISSGSCTPPRMAPRGDACAM